MPVPEPGASKLVRVNARADSVLAEPCCYAGVSTEKSKQRQRIAVPTVPVALERDFTSKPDNPDHVSLVIFILLNHCVVMIVLVAPPLALSHGLTVMTDVPM
jgi:hypothetical protein